MKRLLFLIVPLLLSGCGENPSPQPTPHEHTFETSWTSNVSNHWHKATCEHTDMTKDLGSHVDIDKDGKCDTCAYVLPTPTPVPHEHTFSSDWSNDESSHWHKATCEHVELTKDFGNHIDVNEDYVCDVCLKDLPIPGPAPHEHTFKETYTSDESSHWQEATCEHKELTRNFGTHVDVDKNNICDVCLRVLPSPEPPATRYQITVNNADHFTPVTSSFSCMPKRFPLY